MMAAVSFECLAMNRLREANLSGELVSHTPDDEDSFGNAQAVFRVDSLLMCLIRDRGQVFVEVGSADMPGRFYQFDDVSVAMGWRSTDDVFARKEPEQVGTILSKIRENFAELKQAFSASQEGFTRTRLVKAAREREEAFMKRSRG
jgi:hypothetical protein